MKLAFGSILSMTPATGSVSFLAGHDYWHHPLIGYGVVVTWTPEECGGDDWADHRTRIVPVVLSDSGHPETALHIASAFGDGEWRVEPPRHGMSFPMWIQRRVEFPPPLDASRVSLIASRVLDEIRTPLPAGVHPDPFKGPSEVRSLMLSRHPDTWGAPEDAGFNEAVDLWWEDPS